MTDSGTGDPIDQAEVSTGSGESATANTSGEYTIENVPTGSASVTASASGYTSSTKSTDVTDGDTAALSFSLAEQTVATASVDSITYVESGGKKRDKDLNDTVNTNVGGAAINIALSLDGTVIANGSGTTGTGGSITFKLRRASIWYIHDCGDRSDRQRLLVGRSYAEQLVYEIVLRNLPG